MILSAVMLLAAAAGAAAPPAAKPAAASDKVQNAFWAVYDASLTPEFLALAGPMGVKPLPERPLLEFSAAHKGVSYDCSKMTPVEGGSPAAAAFCGPAGARVPVVALGASVEGFQEALVAGVVGHELVHLLLRHSDKSKAFHETTGNRLLANWLQWGGGAAYHQAQLRAAAAERPDLAPALREKLAGERTIARFRDETPAVTRFDQEQEAEADMLGTQLAKLAGYDEKALGKLFKVLADSGVWETASGAHYDPELRARELAWLHGADADLKMLSVTTPDKPKK